MKILQDGKDSLSIDQMLACLETEAVEAIDFDVLKAALSQLAQLKNSRDGDRPELARFKEEYRGRIIGMLRANLACRKDEDDLAMMHRLSDHPEELKAEELIGMYNKTARRFRTNFPASFGHLTFSGKGSNKANWKEHKI